MKLTGLALLASLAVGTIAAVPAGADQVVVQRTTTTSTHVMDNRPRWHHRRAKVCRTYWHHHRRVTRCRWK